MSLPDKMTVVIPVEIPKGAKITSIHYEKPPGSLRAGAGIKYVPSFEVTEPFLLVIHPV